MPPKRASDAAEPVRAGDAAAPPAAIEAARRSQLAAAEVPHEPSCRCDGRRRDADAAAPEAAPQRRKWSKSGGPAADRKSAGRVMIATGIAHQGRSQDRPQDGTQDRAAAAAAAAQASR